MRAKTPATAQWQSDRVTSRCRHLSDEHERAVAVGLQNFNTAHAVARAGNTNALNYRLHFFVDGQELQRPLFGTAFQAQSIIPFQCLAVTREGAAYAVDEGG